MPSAGSAAGKAANRLAMPMDRSSAPGAVARQNTKSLSRSSRRRVFGGPDGRNGFAPHPNVHGMDPAGGTILAVGDAILDLVTPPLPSGPPGDRQSRVGSFAFLPGGNATNFALAAQSLGATASLVACIGRDWAGDLVAAAVREAGVRAHLRRVAGSTGITMAVAGTDGTRHLITAPGANEQLRGSDVPSSWVARAIHVHRAGFWWATRLIGEPSRRLLRAARRRGVRTSLDIATDPEGWTEARRNAVLHVLPEVDVFFGNEVEVTRVAGVSPIDAAADRIRSLGIDEVVVHQGDRGATAFTASQVVSERAVLAVPRNPTGCGDIFNAAYVLALEQGRPLRERLRYANAAAALHLEDPRRPYPPAAMVERLIRGRRVHRR